MRHTGLGPKSHIWFNDIHRKKAEKSFCPIFVRLRIRTNVAISAIGMQKRGCSSPEEMDREGDEEQIIQKTNMPNSAAPTIAPMGCKRYFATATIAIAHITTAIGSSLPML